MTNNERAEHIAATLYGYCGEKSDPQDPADLAYALADLMHWAELHYDGGFTELEAWAREHYDEEKLDNERPIKVQS